MEVLHVAACLTSSAFWLKLWQLEERPTRDLFRLTATCKVVDVKSDIKDMKLELSWSFILVVVHSTATL